MLRCWDLPHREIDRTVRKRLRKRERERERERERRERERELRKGERES